MRRRRARLLLVAGLATAAASFVPSGQGAKSSVVTIKLLSVTLEQSYILKDVPPQGPSAGDEFLVRDRLYNLVPQFGRAKGALVGIDSGVLKVLPGGHSVSFKGVATLVGGSIAAEGNAPMNKRASTLNVVGGTGRYAHARGTVLIRYAGTPGRATNEFRLTLP